MKRPFRHVIGLAALACWGCDTTTGGPSECTPERQTVFWLDADGDGFGDTNRGPFATCNGLPTYAVLVGGDCDDDDPAIHPDAAEACDGIDQNCNGLRDDNPDPPLYNDADFDGFGDPDSPLPNCDAWGVPNADDCDDEAPARFPGNDEVCDGIDNDCDGILDEADPDFVAIAYEICDDIDNDCDGLLDEADPDVQFIAWYPDADGDGEGAGDEPILACESPGPDFAPGNTDCDDDNSARFSGAIEVCDGIDNDCDGAVEDTQTAWWNADAPYRFRVEVQPPADPTHAPATFDVDFAQLLTEVGSAEVFDSTTLHAVVQDCVDGEGMTSLPVQFIDHQKGLGTMSVTDDAEGDGDGVVALLYDLDGDASTLEAWPAEPVTLGLYFQGPANNEPFASALAVTDTTLQAADMLATFDPDAGGVLASLTLSASPNLASQATAINGNGVRTPSGVLVAQDAPANTLVVFDEGPVSAAIRAESNRANSSGDIELQYTYRAFAGRDELWVTPRSRTNAATDIEGDPDRTIVLRPWQVSHELGESSVCVTDEFDLLWGDVSNDAWGMSWVWTQAPAHVTHLDCNTSETWSAANEVSDTGVGPTGTLPALQFWVDAATLVVLPYEQGDSVAPERQARLDGLELTMLEPEAAN